MKVLIILFMLLPNIARADYLDTAINTINDSLVPKVNGEFGYEAEYRQEMVEGRFVTWVNILKVQRECKIEHIKYLKSGNIVNKDETYCMNRGVLEKDNISLFQIFCHNLTGMKCVDVLAREVNLTVVKKIIDQKITNSQVE